MKNILEKKIIIKCYPQWMAITQNKPKKKKYGIAYGFNENTKVQKSGIDKLLKCIKEMLYEQYGFNDD